MPFHRIRRLEAELEMPLPAATRWEVFKEAAEAFTEVWMALVAAVAAGEVIYIDDTQASVLGLSEELHHKVAEGQATRTGIFTWG
ncbi:MAG: transposase [Candidatus Schekmanbacteria bacterium]|nr:transposase [Candidatus Schekmanbacteria bacterium]